MNKYLSKLAVLSILFSTTILFAYVASDKAEQMQEFGAIMSQMQQKIKDNPNMSKEEQKALMMQMMNSSSMAKNMVKKQKDQLPKMLQILKADRECLSKADTKSDAKICEKASRALSKKLGVDDMVDDDSDFEWNKEKRSKFIPEMDKQISHMEKALPCVEKAKVMSDIAECMQ